MDRGLKLKLIALMIVLRLAVSSVFAQSSAGPGKYPRDVVEGFCKMDWEGMLLTPEGDKAIAGFLVSPHRWYQDQEIVVVDSYVVRGPSIQSRNAHFNVDYRVWGKIDSSLRFVREEGEVSDEPIKDRESYDLVFTNRYNEFGENGPKAVVKGPLAWRIGITPSKPHVRVDAVIRYVKEMRDHASDPAIKENADKTIIALKRFAISSPEQRSSNLRKTPVQIVKQFIRMDLNGKQLTSDGRKEIAALFIRPGSLRWEKIDVMKEIWVGNASIRDENSAKVATGSFRWGMLDSSTALFRLDPAPGVKLLGNYDLVLADDHRELESNGGTPREVNGALEWKISGPVRPPQISVDKAIRYVTEMRDKATDPAIKRNADQSLAKLMGLR